MWSEEKMEEVAEGWIIINVCHPRTNRSYIVSSTFRKTRTDAIKEFISGSGNNWGYWKRNFNFSAVRATQTIQV